MFVSTHIGLRPWFAPREGGFGFLRLAVADAEDATAGAVDAGGLVALAGVAPVEDEAAAVGSGADFDTAEPWIVAEEDIGLVFADVAAAVAFQALHISAAAVHVEREELVTVSLRPLIGLVDHHADVRMTTAKGVRFAIA